MADVGGRRALAAKLIGGLRRRSRSIPFVAQTASTDCGAACLAMVLAYHGRKLDTRKLLEVLSIGRDGSLAQSLIRTAEWFGLRGRGVRLRDVDSLRLRPSAYIILRFRRISRVASTETASRLFVIYYTWKPVTTFKLNRSSYASPATPAMACSSWARSSLRLRR